MIRHELTARSQLDAIVVHDEVLSLALSREASEAAADARDASGGNNEDDDDDAGDGAGPAHGSASAVACPWLRDAVSAYSTAADRAGANGDWRAECMLGTVLEAGGAAPSVYLPRLHRACELVGPIDPRRMSVVQRTSPTRLASPADVVECHYRMYAAAWRLLRDGFSDTGLLDRCTRAAAGTQRRFAGDALRRTLMRRVADGLLSCVNAPEVGVEVSLNT